MLPMHLSCANKFPEPALAVPMMISQRTAPAAPLLETTKTSEGEGAKFRTMRLGACGWGLSQRTAIGRITSAPNSFGSYYGDCIGSEDTKWYQCQRQSKCSYPLWEREFRAIGCFRLLDWTGWIMGFVFAFLFSLAICIDLLANACMCYIDLLRTCAAL